HRRKPNARRKRFPRASRRCRGCASWKGCRPSGSYRVVARIEIPSTATTTSAPFHNQVSGASSLKDVRQRPMLLLHSVVVKNATRKGRVFHVNPCATRFLPNDCSQDFMQITDP